MAMTTTKKPTKRQLDLARAVDQLTRKMGYSPTLKECAALLSVNVPRAHLLAHQARERGLVEFRDGQARTIRVVDRSKLGRKGSSRA
jgi:SOS-response transcriptional repressor LexA